MANKKAATITDEEKRFVHAWLENGRNGVAAAMATGSKSDKGAAVRACRTLARPRVVAYVGECVQEAIANLETEKAGAVASLQECLAGLTAHARARLGDFVTEHGEVKFDAMQTAPAGLVKKFQRLVTVSESGQVFERTNLELESSQAAFTTLLKYHTDALRAAEDEAPKDTLGLFADALRGLATVAKGHPGLMKALMRRWMSGDVIDVPTLPAARRLPAEAGA